MPGVVAHQHQGAARNDPPDFPHPVLKLPAGFDVVEKHIQRLVGEGGGQVVMPGVEMEGEIQTGGLNQLFHRRRLLPKQMGIGGVYSDMHGAADLLPRKWYRALDLF